MIPSQIGETAGSRKPKGAKWKSLDLVGVGVLTGINLSAYFSLSGFFYWETLLPADRAAIPPRTWFYNNFSVLLATALLPSFWWSGVMFIYF
ncbi:hypothetical protein BDR07DRAFT_1436929 [Suillus spraguei]|nr:hypothetical protein BDR07DRAFT_1436929 [Suillus spraguei]